MQGALAKIHELVNLFGLTRNDVFPVLKRGPKKGQAVAAKYRDPETGATWSGRGREPRWLQGKDKTKYAIQPSH